MDTDGHRAADRASPRSPHRSKGADSRRRNEGELQRELEDLAAAPGERRDSGTGELFEPVFADGKGEEWSVEALGAGSLELLEILASQALDLKEIGETRLPAVAAGEVVGHRREREDGVPAGEGIEVADDGKCRALNYGYLCLIDGRLSVRSPVWVDPAGLRAHWLLLDERPQQLTRERVLERLAAAGVVAGIAGKEIEALVERVKRGEHACGAVAVAAGRPAENGEDAQVEILVERERIAGEEREDGSVDFREVNFATLVQTGQLVARRIPPTAGRPGRDVRGKELAAADGWEGILKPGENVEKRVEGGVELFHATVNGALREENDEIAVTRLLHIAGDVDFKTGNLDFDGEICVEGSVIQGFSVKASGDIAIAGTVEQGARVTAGRNLVVGKGVVGRKTQVEAGGQARAQFVQEATVTAGQDVVVGNYAFQAQLRAGRWVRVMQGVGEKGGSLVGGQTWAQAGIEAHIIGSASQAPTALMAGVGSEHIRNLDRLKEGVDAAYNQLRRLLSQFGLTRVDVGQIKNMIAAAVGPRRKLLANKARQLGQVVQTYQKLLATRQQLEKRIATQMQGAEIKALEKAFPGVEIQLGEHRRKLEEGVASPCFHVVDGQLVER